MPITDRQTLYRRFENFAKPNEQDFRNVFDSFFHKQEDINGWHYHFFENLLSPIPQWPEGLGRLAGNPTDGFRYLFHSAGAATFFTTTTGSPLFTSHIRISQDGNNDPIRGMSALTMQMRIPRNVYRVTDISIHGYLRGGDLEPNIVAIEPNIVANLYYQLQLVSINDDEIIEDRVNVIPLVLNQELNIEEPIPNGSFQVDLKNEVLRLSIILESEIPYIENLASQFLSLDLLNVGIYCSEL